MTYRSLWSPFIILLSISFCLQACKSSSSPTEIVDSSAIAIPSQVQSIYLRGEGDDVAGDGSITAPFKTAQKAFEAAYALEINVVIDLGVGSFGGVDLNLANASEWPSRISVHGVSVAESHLGGIQANGQDGSYLPNQSWGFPQTQATSGKPITIIGNGTVNLGDISSNGGSKSYWDSLSSCNGGAISLTEVIAGSISSRSGEGNCSSGDISVTTSVTGDIVSSGKYGDSGGNGGNITVLESAVGNVSADGFEGFAQGGNGGAISVSRSSTGNLSTNGGYANYSGTPGNVLVEESQTGHITSTAGDCYDVKCLDGGYITLNNSSVGNVSANGGSGGDFYGMGSGGNGGTISLLNASIAGIITANGGAGGSGESGNGGTVNLSTLATWGSISVAPGASGSPLGTTGTINTGP